VYGASPPEVARKKDSVMSGKACTRKETDIRRK